MKTNQCFPADKCPVGCGRSVQRGHLTCKPCWFRVPKDLRDKVWRAYRNFNQADIGTDRIEALKKLRQAQEAAIASIT